MLEFIKAITRKLKSVELILSAGNKKLGKFGDPTLTYELLNKEEESRKLIFNDDLVLGSKKNFLDVGGRDGDLINLLGDKGNFNYHEEMYKKNKQRFDSIYNYYGLDLIPAGERVLYGDICSKHFKDAYKEKKGFFDLIYSNNVFEHLNKPWIAVENINYLLKDGGVVITIVPFSLRFHAVPNDYFRYTHSAIYSLFSDFSDYQIIKTGYDILGRRNNWQGGGDNDDFVPEDEFGAWREAWITFTALKKIGNH